ncbi:MAG: hypothetical protein V6Z86_02740, partial [Hyphomicrobiales bacterium]
RPGLRTTQAEALAEEQASLIDERLATKQDLKELEGALKRDIKQLEAGPTKQDIADVKRDIRESEQRVNQTWRHDRGGGRRDGRSGQAVVTLSFPDCGFPMERRGQGDIRRIEFPGQPSGRFHWEKLSRF